MSSVVWHYWTEKTDLTTTKYNGIKAFLKSHFNLVPSLWIWGKNNSYHQGEWGVISSRGINPISKGGLISESAVGCHQLSGTTGPKKQIFLLQSTMKPKSFWSRNVWFIKIRTTNYLSLWLYEYFWIILLRAPSILHFKGLGMRNLQYKMRICQKSSTFRAKSKQHKFPVEKTCLWLVGLLCN